jgi:hypothetical protein
MTKLTKGARVHWTSHRGKKRSGIYIFDFATKNLSYVVGDWDRRGHEIFKGRLTTKEHSDADAELQQT